MRRWRMRSRLSGQIEGVPDLQPGAEPRLRLVGGRPGRSLLWPVFFAALWLFLALGLLSCQSGGEESGPRLVVNWRPTPMASRTPLPALEEDAVLEEKVQPTVQTEPEQSIDDEAETPETPLVIPTLAPTPIPAGVYVRESDGFEVVYPTSWNLGDSSSLGVQLYDPGFNLIISVSSQILEEESSYESLLEQYQSEVDFLHDVTVISEEEIPFGESGDIKVAMLSAVDDEGQQINVRLAHMADSGRAKQMVVFGQQEDMEARQATLNAMLGQAKPGGTQVFGLDRDETLVLLGGDPLPRFLDPARTTGSAGGYVGLLYRGLVHLNADLQIVPDLAEGWSVSDDGTVYTFTLREGVTFADGRPITAADVKASWERAADPDTGSTTASTYLGDILGVNEKLAGESDEISGVVVMDDKTLEVTLDGPKPYFLAKLTYPTSFIIDEDTVNDEDEEWVYEPNASGPFALGEFRQDEALIFERNDAYYDSGEIANVVYLLYRIGTGMSLFEANEVDIVYLNATEKQDVRLPSNEFHDQWQSTTSLCTSLVQINNARPPLDDLNVRRALTLSVDREGLNEIRAEGMDLEASTILPPAMPGHSLQLAEDRLEAGYDPDSARAALAESAYASGLPPITLVAGGYGDTESDFINALVDDWREALGANVTVEYLDPENYSEVARGYDAHLFSYGWCADYPDPQNFLDVLYHDESDFNIAGYANDEVSALLVEARTELDPARRLELYHNIETMLLEDYAAIPLLHNVADILVNSRVNGYVLSPVNDSPINMLRLETAEGE